MHTDQVSAACERAEILMNQGAPRQDVFSCLIEAAESVSAPGAVSSILVLDEQGLLRNGHSPGLPADYLAAIDRLKPHPRVGTCAAATPSAAMIRPQARYMPLKALMVCMPPPWK